MNPVKIESKVTGTDMVGQSGLKRYSDEINMLEYVRVVLKRKVLIVGLTFFGLIGGFTAALVKGPTFVAEAVIAAKEQEGQAAASNLSALGAIGGLVASQFNMVGSPGLDKIDIILNSRKFNAEMIEKYDLLPAIYAQLRPDLYKKHYDTISNSWDEQFPEPKILGVGKKLKEEFLQKETHKNKTMTLRVESGDSLFSETLLAKYLEYLNYYIQTSVRSEAKGNVVYLENQLLSISDPLLREKLQGMIALEVEKVMLVSKEAFMIIDPQYCSKQHKEKKLYPVVFSFALFFMSATFIIFLHALKRERELFRLKSAD